MRSPPSTARSRTRGQHTATGPMPVTISRSGKCPWRTNCARPSAVSLSAWSPRKPATSASTACANSARAPLRKISVNGSLKVPGCASLITLSWVTAYHSFGGEVEAFEHPHDTPPHPFIPSPTFAHSSILLNQDLSEDFEVASERCLDSGTVMVIDGEGNLSECQQPYDKRVAGVIAGGGEFRPAIVLGRQASEQMRLPIALVGKVSCKVDASYSQIEIGDLLTTSRTPGHAMRVADSGRAFGAVIGKALRPLAEGRGYIPILIALQ